jgi:hypothetical protein
VQLRPQVTSDILSLAGQVDKKNKILSIKCTTLYPHPTDPDRAFMSTLEINKMGSMPKWALNFIMSVTAPSLMKGLEQRCGPIPLSRKHAVARRARLRTARLGRRLASTCTFQNATH